MQGIVDEICDGDETWALAGIQSACSFPPINTRKIDSTISYQTVRVLWVVAAELLCDDPCRITNV